MAGAVTRDAIATAQAELEREGLAAWLVFDFRGSNRFAARFLPAGALLSRRVFLLIPREGRPVMLAGALETGSLRMPEAEIRGYASRDSLVEALRALLPDGPVAMEVSPNGDVPYVSVVDAGTVDLLRGLGAEIVSSAELLQGFATWDEAQVRAHREAARGTMEVLDEAWDALRSRAREGREVRESEIQGVVAAGFDARGLVYDHKAIVGFGPNAGNPHYLPVAGQDRALTPGDAILVDLFARLPAEGAPYADVTWMGTYGPASDAFEHAFRAVAEARDVGVRTLREAHAAGRRLQGREVDRAVRDHLSASGYADAFVHRTGHSLGSRHTHGDAAHFDDFETRDTRTVRPGMGFTIEPGVYLPDFGVRSELDVLLRDDGLEVTTGVQAEPVRVPLGPRHR
ncbi:MAG: M24 family metallopeptidase [Trueperaceae bacterium]|nr:M24 family metallopeptidase [Trueperaceae bacterium]